MAGPSHGAQRASPHQAPDLSARAPRVARASTAGIAAAIAVIMALGTQLLGADFARAATPAHSPGTSRPGSTTAGGATGLKAVFIVGPAGSSTYSDLDESEALARQAEDLGMDVRRIFTPNATWDRVLNVIQDANLVVYMGHGNGWPSPYPPFQERTKDGFGLNYGSGGTTSPTDYHGGNQIRNNVRLADHAVVVLLHACYASGNPEPGMGIASASDWGDRNIAVQRVDNFAASFLAAGAGTVFAFGWEQHFNLPAMLANTGKTMDDIFMTRNDHVNGPAAFMGRYDYYRDSERTSWARMHLDPDNSYGHYRAVTGDLEMTAADWRGEPPSPDTTPPDLTGIESDVAGRIVPADAPTPISFSPNGDGIEDSVAIVGSLSEGAHLDVVVTDGTGATVRDLTRWSERGSASISWDGTDEAGAPVSDGLYHLTVSPRDRAGNVGSPAAIDVRVLTTLRSPNASARAIYVSDGDDLASSVTFDATLARDATVSWQVEDADGNVVMTHLEEGVIPAGQLSWSWNGTDQTGSPVPDGTYSGVVSATTEDGTVTYSRSVFVGAYRLRLSDMTPRRGQKIGITLLNTELMGSAPKVRIKQPRLKAYTFKLIKSNDHKYRLSVTLSSKGRTGTLTITIIGTDAGGQVATITKKVRLR